MNVSKPLRVLVVDDDALASRIIQLHLEKAGHQVVGCAKNGREAIEMTRALGPDIVLMDIEMPEMDGLEATRIILDQCPRPVVLLSALENAELVAQASLAGAGAYLVKPANANMLARTIAIALARFDDLMKLRELNAALRKAQAEIKTLTGLLPICASCKKIRDTKGAWEQVEVYVQRHSAASFTHGICPECTKKLFPELG